MNALLAHGGVRADRLLEAKGGVRIHALQAGRGETMVLLHGAGGGAANWFGIMQPLSAAFRVLAPDLPGFGFSPPLDVMPPLGSAVAGAVLRWLDARGEGDVHLVGTSLGGLIALRLAQQAAERVKSLTIIDAAGLGAEVPLLVRLGTLPPLRGFAGSSSRAGLRFFFERYLTASALPAERRRLLLDYIRASARAGGNETLIANLPRFATMRGQSEVLSDQELRAVRTPTLVLWGERDRFIPVAHGYHAARFLPNVNVCVVPGSGHSPNWEMPAEVVRAILGFAAPSPA